MSEQQRHEGFDANGSIGFRHVPDDQVVHLVAVGPGGLEVAHELADGIVHEVFDDAGSTNARHVAEVAASPAAEGVPSTAAAGEGLQPLPPAPRMTNEIREQIRGKLFSAQAAAEQALDLIPAELEELRLRVQVASDGLSKAFDDASQDL